VKDRFTRLAPSADAKVDIASRVVRYRFSDESEGRDKIIVKADAWQTANFNANPVFLWAHLHEEPPIGRVIDLHTQSRQLLGGVKYAETDFAQTIFELVADRYLGATSTSWLPIEAPETRSDGVIVFGAVDLLEISQVNIPALPTALAQAGARGINLRPLAAWAERALDNGGCRTVPRPQLEAIQRATRHRPRTRSERLRRAQQIIERGRRQAVAAEIGARARRENW
jgi:hypothetical protein